MLRREAAIFAVGERALDVRDDRIDRHAAFRMRLRIEEDLRMRDVIGEGFFDIRHRHVVEVLLVLVQKHARARVINVQKRL